MDCIYLSAENDIEDIENMSKVCLIISIKFTEISSSYLVSKLIQRINFHIKEINFLKLLPNSLSHLLSSYDWLLSLISNEFKDNRKNTLLQVSRKSICLLNELVEDIRFLDFEPKETLLV